MIKNILLSTILIVTFTTINFGQKVAIVDVAQILENLPEYIEAQSEIDKISANWQQEISQEYDKIKSMYNKYQAEQVLLSEEVKIEREEEIMGREKEVRDLQKKHFGPEGDLFRKRQELVSPIQDQVFTAIEKYAESKGFDIIFDKSGSAGLLYANSEYDKTEEVAKQLGIRN